MNDYLKMHLSDCLAERHGIAAKAGSLARFREAVKANPNLRAEAEDCLGSFDEGVLQRDHISRVYKQVLTEVLGG